MTCRELHNAKLAIGSYFKIEYYSTLYSEWSTSIYVITSMYEDYMT